IATFALDAGSAAAQTYPSRPIRIVVPFVAGGAVDALARMMGAKLSETLGQPVIVENRPGAAGNVAADAVAKAPPDGHTILQNTNGQAISPSIYRSLPFDVVRDFVPVTQLVASQLVLVASPKLSASSVAELIALAKAKPGALNYGMTGVGNPLHLTMEMFMTAAGIEMQPIPYKATREFSPLSSPARSRWRLRRWRRLCRMSRPGRCARWRSPAPSARRHCPACPRSPRAGLPGSNPRAGKAGSCRPTRRPTSSTSSSNAPRQPWPRPTCSSVCVSPATRPSAARPLSSSSASRPTSRNLPRSSRKPIFLETCTSSRELGLFAAVCYPIATISKCLVHDLGGLIVRTMNKVPVSAERDAGRGVAKPAADH